MIRRHSKMYVKVLLWSALLICLAILIFAIWLLFVPNSYNRLSAGESTQVSTSGNADAVQTEVSGFLAVLKGETAQLEGGSDWHSTDESIATVDENGIVTGITPGACQMQSDNACMQVVVRQLEQRSGCTYVDGVLIVNKTYSLPEDYDPGLQPIAEAAFAELSAAAAEEGLDLYIGSSYRSYAYQVEIYENYAELYGWEQADTFSARPGHSEHQTGLTIDCNTIDDAFGETPEAAWLAQHCIEYGFIIRFPQGKEDITGYKYEPWHIRYVGVETAQEIQKYGLTLEEYLGVKSEYTSPWQS